jgi:hypothetical protein
VALGCCAFVRIDVDGIVGAGLHAGFTPDTSFGTEVDDPILALVHRSHRTDGDAGRILTMIAAGHLEHAAGIRKCSLLDVFHPRAIDGERNVVFRLAGYGAGVTTDALAVIDDESVSHPDFSANEPASGLCIVSDRPVGVSYRLEAK